MQMCTRFSLWIHNKRYMAREGASANLGGAQLQSQPAYGKGFVLGRILYKPFLLDFVTQDIKVDAGRSEEV